MTSSSEQTTALIAGARRWAERNGVSVPSEIIFDLCTALEEATANVVAMTCRCGFGGQHDPANTRCPAFVGGTE